MKLHPCSTSPARTWLPLGIGVGTALGVALGHIALGVALGAAFGLVMHIRTARNA